MTSSDHPFSSPAFVGLAGVALIALSAASFTSGMMRQLRVPAPDHSATVVVLAPTDAPPPLPAELLAAAAAAVANPAPTANPVRRRPVRRPLVEEAPPQAAAPPALAATDAASEAVAIAPQLPDLAPPPRLSLEPLEAAP